MVMATNLTIWYQGKEYEPLRYHMVNWHYCSEQFCEIANNLNLNSQNMVRISNLFLSILFYFCSHHNKGILKPARYLCYHHSCGRNAHRKMLVQLIVDVPILWNIKFLLTKNKQTNNRNWNYKLIDYHGVTFQYIKTRLLLKRMVSLWEIGYTVKVRILVILVPCHSHSC